MRTIAAVMWGVLIVGIAAAGLVTWRMSRGPINLGFLNTRLESLLTARDGSARVDIGSTAIEWDSRDRKLDVRARDLRVLGPGGAPRAAIPELSVGIAPGALLLGTVAPRSLEAIAPRITITRQPDGRLEAGIGQQPDAESTRLLMGALLGEPRGAPGTLQRFSVRDAEVVVDDRASGATWHATNLRLAARRDGGGLVIDRLAFDIDPASVAASGRLRGSTADLDVTVTRLPTRLLERWWPAGVAPAVRHWVLANVSGGSVTRARAMLSASLGDVEGARVNVGSVRGQVAFAGLEVGWRGGMPPFTGVGGTGTFSSAGWELRVARGELEGIDLIRALVRPDGTGSQAIDADAVVRAPLSKVLALLERPAMKTISRFPFRPGEISGGATARVLVQVPLDRAAVSVQAHGDLRSVSLRRAFRGRNVNARKMQFALDDDAFQMQGEISIGRAPLHLRWRESLGGSDRGDRVISIKGRLDAEGRHAFGANFDTWLEGPIDLQARLQPKRNDATSMQVVLDLTPARIDLPLIAMVKEIGAPGRSRARLVLANGQVTAVDDFRMEAAGTAIGGKALLGAGESWKSVDGTITMAPHVEGVEAPRITIGIKPAGTNSQLTATANDAGALFRTVDSYAVASGGQMKLLGIIRLGVSGVPLTGTLTAERFVLKRSPLVAKIAALGGLGHVIDLLSNDGLPFSQLSATFTQRAAAITLSEAVAASPGLALTARGTIDRSNDELAIEGTLVPNYTTLTRLTADLPKTGETLDGIDGERVVALDFSASGSLADPYVTANPAKGIAPGMLRDLLRLTNVRRGPVRASKGKGKGEGAIDVIEDEPSETRKRKKGGARATRKPAAKPRVRRRAPAPAGPSAPDTGTE